MSGWSRQTAHKAARRLTIVLASLFACVAAVAYDLVWSDEFDGTAIDPAKWEHEINGLGGGNNELQFYTGNTTNSRVGNGMLVIEARREPFYSRDYTSARLRTKGRAEFLYGKFEARIKVPRGQGFWPAFWMFPAESQYGGWAAGGEIDIMETVNAADFIAGSIHYGGEWPNNQSSGQRIESGTAPFTEAFSEDFHVYTVEWEPTRIQWYVDGQLYATQRSWWTSGGSYPAPFNQPFFIILNLAVGGNWPGPPDDTTQFPAQMLVDWVRVYQKIGDVPTVQITEPANGATLTAGTSILRAEAVDPEDLITRVNFYVNDELVGVDYALPYSQAWEATAGCYEIRVEAVDGGGQIAEDVRKVAVDSTCTPTYLDVDANGVVDAVDIQLVINRVLGSPCDRCDLNRDDRVDAVDIQIIINAVLGLG